jgi:hypothetical protein
MAVDVDRIGVADIGVVPGEAMTDTVVGALDEGAEMGCERAAGEEADLLHREVVVRGEARRGAARLRRLGVRESRLQEGRKWRSFPVAAFQLVAAELEPPAERRQLEKGGMAGGARLPGLSRIKR